MTRLFLKGVTGIDCGILDPTLGLIGQSWLVDLGIEGQRNAQGMIVDFGVLKPTLREICGNSLDHRLVVPRLSPALDCEKTRDGLLIRYAFGAGQALTHLSPLASVHQVAAARIDKSALEASLQQELMSRLAGSSVAACTVALRETRAETPNSFRYTHGLRQHGGECQRIGHGHSSLLEVRIEGKRLASEEARLAAQLLNQHVVARNDIIKTENAMVRLGYDAQTGRHELTLPADRTYVLDGEATVENIVEQLADDCAARHDGKHVEVTAWEGIGKGAIAERN